MRTLYFYHEIENQYEEYLNECYSVVDICGYEYEAGRALRLIDETAFRCGVCDFVSEDFEEVTAKDMTKEELEHHFMDKDSSNTLYCRID